MGRLPRTIFLKACVAALVVALLQAALTAAVFHRWAGEPLTDELDRKALAVGQAMKAEIERAAEVGIPLDELRGVEPFFRRLLDDNPDVRFIAMTAPDKTPLHYAGITRARLEEVLEPADTAFEERRLAGGMTEARSRHIFGGLSVDIRPIGPAAYPLALLHVAVEGDFVMHILRRNWPMFAVAGTAGAAAGLLCALVLTLRIGRRLRLLDSSIARAADGRPALLADSGQRDEISYATRAFNAVLHALRVRYDDTLDQAEDARDAAIGRTVRDSLERIRRGLVQRLEPAFGDIPPTPPTAVGRFGRNVSIRLRLTAIISLAGLLLAVGLGYGSIVRERLLAESYHEDRQAALKTVWKTLSQRETDTVARLLTPLRRNAGIRSALLDGDTLLAARLIEDIAVRNGLERLVTFDPSDEAGGRLFVGRNPLSPRMARRVVDTGTPASGGDIDADGQPVWTVAAALGDAGQGGMLIVAAGIPLASAILEAGAVLGGEAFLVGNEGGLIFGTDPPLWQDLDADSGDYAVTTTNIPALNGGRLAALHVVADVSEFAAQQQALRIAFFGAAAIFAGIALWVLYANLRGSLRPLDRVIGVLEALSEGRRGVWLEQETGTDEIARIAKAVEAYRSSLGEVERLSAERRRAQRRRERFLRQQMAGLTSAVGAEARQAVTEQLARLEREGASDEFEALTLVFEQMAQRIREQHGRLTELVEELREALKHKERLAAIESELSIARDLQLSVLPRETPPQRTVEVAAQMIPAKEVGGDFYDYFAIDEHRIGLVIADVSGKGIPAAFFMLIARTLLKATALIGESPARVLTALNDMLEAENEQMMFVTAFYAVVDTGTGHVTFANAGHNPTYRIDGAGRLSTLPMESGVALAIMPGFRFVEGETTLAPGETLFFYTDGVNEAFNEAGEQFGEPRLEAELTAVAGSASTVICEAVRASVEAFAAGVEQSDDITTVAMRYLGGGSTAP